VKLLFDENLSPRLVRAMAPEFPGSAHVRDIDLSACADRAIWDHARRHDFAIVSKDNDFRQLSFMNGAPPKVVWLSVGNGATRTIEAVLRRHVERILAFGIDETASLLVITGDDLVASL
jgi:predicted nuclease of predicted toxin-antitoxin system